jgi:hypothetical protein
MNNAYANTVTVIDIAVLVDEVLDEQNRRRVEYSLLKTTGVRRARFSDARQHLLVVGYDPRQIDAMRILKLVRQHQLHVRILGGLYNPFHAAVQSLPGRWWPLGLARAAGTHPAAVAGDDETGNGYAVL